MAETGGLFRLAIRLMVACTTEFDSAEWLSDLASLLGVIFQIRDDYINLQSSEVRPPFIEPAPFNVMLTIAIVVCRS